MYRYELRDERRTEQTRSSTHIEGVKRDILRTLSLGVPKDLKSAIIGNRLGQHVREV